MATAGLLPLMSENGREGWSDGGGDQVEDEFACVGALRGTLVSFHPSVERIFGVSFRIGREEDAELSHNGQIWLKLRGVRKNVLAAKHFVRGVVNQEEQQEVPYPEVLHCVFCGARGLFMDCLIKNTFAHIVVGSPGFLLISGLTEPVVRAYSLITDLVERYEGTQGCRTEAGDRGAGESLDSRRAFKSLVENWEDRHTLDLLVLPGSVKETLLDLVRESGLGSNPGHGDTESQRLWETQSDVERLTLLDNRVGETRQVHGIPTSADKPLENSTHHQEDPDARLQNNEPFGSPGVQGRDGTREGTGRDTASPDPFLRFFPPIVDFRGKAEGAEAGRECSPQEVGEEEQQEKVEEEEEEEEEEGEGEGEGGELLLSVGSRVEFGLLLKFFTAMGYDEGVVRRVLARTGPREASQLLDLVQQEQDLYGREKNLNHNRPSETEHIEGEGEERRDEGTEGGVRCGVRGREGHREEEEWRDEGLQVKKSATGRGVGVGVKEGVVKGEMAGEEQRMGGGERRREDTLGEGSDDGGQERGKEDFVLGVLLRAAASCGYTEEKVAEVYSMQPELSTRLLLLELQREGARETDTQAAERGMEGPMEVDEVVLEVQREAGKREAVAQPFTTAGKRGEKKSLKGKSERKTDEEGGVKVPNQTTDGHIVQLDPAQWNVKKHFQPFPTQPSPHQFPPQIDPQLPQLNTPHQTNPPLVRGPPQPTYPVTLPSQTTNHLTRHPHPTLPPTLTPQLTYPQTLAPQTTFTPILLPALTTNNPSATRTKDRRGFSAHLAGAMVTGEQRFLEGLQTPFDLKLNDQPGDEGLRMVIIDGSNVAMSHGLGHFFSCRGIALAVQHFWTEGHRRISIFLPQWRQKRDPRIKEQHFLTELQNLGLLSYTPSREVQGKRINSYDDRFMLQLAQKTDGVIVTNDNLRDLLVESHVFKDIIKKRLLQYTFVGDHFMVPDDPLGRGGPHLDDFLRSQHRPPVPGSHTFAGVASSLPSSRAPRAHTELLQFRDWTPGVPVDSDDSDRGQGRGRRRGQGRAGHMAIGQGQGVERSAEETARLRESLSQVFPGQDSMVTLVLQCNPTVTDINSLSHFILEQQRESEQGAAD